jgi:hypothetical protein
MEDNTIIPFWFKRPDLYLQNQFKDMIDYSLLKDFSRVDIIIGGDHGSGKYDDEGELSFTWEKDSIVSNPNCKCILFKR